MRRRFHVLLATGLAAFSLVQGSSAIAAGAIELPESYPAAPQDFAVDAREAARIANRDPLVHEQLAERGRLEMRIEAKPGKWQVGYFDGADEVVQVHVDPGSGAVRESWTGHQVAWPMARGYEGQFGHALNAWYVWIPLAVAFVLGLFDFRRPLRTAHLDLIALVAFGVSHIYFNRGEIGLSVPLAYPPLVYLLARMAWLGFRRRSSGGGLRPSAPVAILAFACIFLVAFRGALNVADSGVIDVGYAGVIGADRITHGEPLYGEGAFPDDNPSGDTYGPAAYLTYVPFEAILPWSGDWDELPAAHAAALFFDLACVAGLFALGYRLRPGNRRAARATGVTLAFAWLAYPYTAFALQSNSNDSLVAALLIWGLVLFASPIARGALIAAAALTKLAPVALAPLFIAGGRGLAAGARRGPLLAAATALAVAGLLLLHPAVDPGLATFWERTVENQLDRTSPFSLWGQLDGVETIQRGVLGATALLALGAAFVPVRRDLPRIAALAAAILIGAQIAADHWFYLYIPWFAGLVFVALMDSGQDPHPRAAPSGG